MELTLALARGSFRLDLQSRLRLWRKLASLLANGVPILRALDELRSRRQQTAGTGHHEVLALGHWIASIGNGSTLSSSIRGWVTPDEELLIHAGEQHGDMVAAFGRLELILTARRRIRSAVLGAVAYPSVLLVLLFALLIFYAWKIIPVYQEVVQLRGGRFDGVAASLVWLAEATRSWVWLWILSVLGVVALFFWSLPRWDGALRVRLDRSAPYGIYRVMRGTSWMLALSALMSVGERVEDALIALRRRQDGRWARNRTDRCLAGIRRGLSLGVALQAARTEFPDREVIADILVYSRLKGMNEAMATLATDLLEGALSRIQMQSVLMRNVAFLLVAGAVAWTTGGLIAMNLQMGRILSGAITAANSSLPWTGA
ncbi:MAG: type II secretion system F family protein [Burkholderiales bacterium]|jgi:type II secretory pathway component PulF|nr:type II secretion system F family protein [Burkholderiales bacterium]